MPTLAGFIAWATAVMGLSTTVISPTSPGWQNALTVALAMIPDRLAKINCDIYTLTVYNWAGSQLLQYQTDIPGQNFFTNARLNYGINSFTPGVVSGAGDQSSYETLAVGRGLQDLQLMDLQRIKDPYGRQALAFLQELGPLWGMS